MLIPQIEKKIWTEKDHEWALACARMLEKSVHTRKDAKERKKENINIQSSSRVRKHPIPSILQ